MGQTSCARVGDDIAHGGNGGPVVVGMLPILEKEQAMRCVRPGPICSHPSPIEV